MEVVSLPMSIFYFQLDDKNDTIFKTTYVVLYVIVIIIHYYLDCLWQCLSGFVLKKKVNFTHLFLYLIIL